MKDYRCGICGNDFESRDNAEKCEMRGIVMFSKKKGDAVRFIRSVKNESSDTWTYETVPGVVMRVNILPPPQYPGHEYGIAGTSYLVKEKNGNESLQSSLLNDPMKIVTWGKFKQFITPAKRTPLP